jgi:hypothetical protein
MMKKLKEFEKQKPWIVELYKEAAEMTKENTKKSVTGAEASRKGVFHENFN